MVYFVAFILFLMEFLLANIVALIRRHMMWRLIWVCTVCLLSIYGFPGKNGLKYHEIYQTSLDLIFETDKKRHTEITLEAKNTPKKLKLNRLGLIESVHDQ